MIGLDMYFGKVNLLVWMMCWREVNWLGVYWCDVGKKRWEIESRWGDGGGMRKYYKVE